MQNKYYINLSKNNYFKMANQPPQKKQHTLDKFFNKKQNREIETQNEMENSTEIIEDSLENQVPTDLGENFPAQPIIKFPKQALDYN